jgi:hypothetical protein
MKSRNSSRLAGKQQPRGSYEPFFQVGGSMFATEKPDENTKKYERKTSIPKKNTRFSQISDLNPIDGKGATFPRTQNRDNSLLNF